MHAPPAKPAPFSSRCMGSRYVRLQLWTQKVAASREPRWFPNPLRPQSREPKSLSPYSLRLDLSLLASRLDDSGALFERYRMSRQEYQRVPNDEAIEMKESGSGSTPLPKAADEPPPSRGMVIFSVLFYLVAAIVVSRHVPTSARRRA